MTPTPWHVGKKYPSDVYSKSETILGGTLVARSTIDDAAHIVKCVNAHDDLLAALKDFANPFNGDNLDQIADDYGVVTSRKVAAARAAIEKVTA